MEMAVPGLKKEWVRVNITNDGLLHVAIENKMEHKEESKENHEPRHERSRRHPHHRHPEDHSRAGGQGAEEHRGEIKILAPHIND